MSNRPRLALAALAAALVCVPSAGASRGMLVGLLDEAALYDDPAYVFPLMEQARTQVLRVNLYWGGRVGVATARPERATDPDDAAYDWELYDRTVNYAAQHRIRLLFSIYGTPGWANGGAGVNVPPKRMSDLRNFAYAAAKRYGGTFPGADGRSLPPVRFWLAWNEPNYPIGLKRQYRRVGSGYVVQSAIDYAKICAAVYNGVHATLVRGERVACGATGPRGNNQPRSSRPTVAPLTFMRALKAAGLRTFDAYAHHPYYGLKSETPTTRPSSTAVTIANIGKLVSEVTRLWGPRRIWITEYGYQTNPPDSAFGVSYAKQAAYMRQAFDIARRNPRIDLMLWFLLRDEPKLGGWQSGLMTRTGKKKPSF
ncbi:MAG TPA: glycosyl hydrolase, partial [Gaiellaceae bacterium]|nr:glycosyl hydrolase [Gaiellaceae bacterium]